jgi:hypothetical protein
VRWSRCRQVSWLGLAIVVSWFAPLAITYTVPDFSALRYSWEDHVLASVLGNRFAFGAGSGLTGPPLALIGKISLVLHTVVGGAVIILGILQFSGRLRTRHPRVHRAIGRSYIGCVLVCVAGAIALLVRTPLTSTFSGASYGLWLWMLAIATAASAVTAVITARHRVFLAHQYWAAYSFALVMSAPLLRIEWMAVGLFWHTTKEELNRAAELWTVPLLLTCALVATRLWTPKRERPGGPTQPFMPSWRGLAVLLPVTVACSIGIGYACRAVDPLTAQIVLRGFVLPLSLQFLCFAAVAGYAHRAGRPRAAATWRLHTAGALLAIPATLAIFPLLDQFMPTADALLGAAAIGWMAVASVGYLLAVPGKLIKRPADPHPVAAGPAKVQSPSSAAILGSSRTVPWLCSPTRSGPKFDGTTYYRHVAGERHRIGLRARRCQVRDSAQAGSGPCVDRL